MEDKILSTPKPLSFQRFLRGPLLALVVGLALFYLVMQPPLKDLGLMVQYMTLTSLLSVFLSYGAYRLGWIRRSPRIQWTLMIGYAISGLLVFLNVWIVARLMFASEHDLLLATVLLAFATGIAMSLGFFSSVSLTDRILTLEEAARKIAGGQLETQVSDTGRDEMASLAASFNEMAAQLKASEQRQLELENLRSDLIAWVSHDLRTPLTSIRAILEALGDGLIDDPVTMQRYLQTAQRDIRSLSMLIDDLFEMAQIDAGGLKLSCEYSSLADLISDTIESFTELAKRKSVALSGCVESGTDPVKMDVERMGRVLANLVGNAIRHTLPGGQVQISASRADRHVQIEVRDNGAGIKTEDLPHVFERFYRGEKSRNRATGGAGLGLAIARSIVEAHEGQIEVHSVEGQETVFSISLPQS